MLEYNKRHHLVTTIKETNKDPKQLFRALNSILGNKNETSYQKVPPIVSWQRTSQITFWKK